LKQYASPAFWALYSDLPAEVRALADKNYELLNTDPRHPSLHFKRIGPLWSVRVGGHYRALGDDVADGVQWFWIGPHADYDKLVGQQAVAADRDTSARRRRERSISSCARAAHHTAARGR